MNFVIAFILYLVILSVGAGVGKIFHFVSNKDSLSENIFISSSIGFFIVGYLIFAITYAGFLTKRNIVILFLILGFCFAFF